jgi:hypothetical protein
VRQWLDARGVNGPHGLNKAKKIVELGKHAIAFIGREFQARQIGNACDVKRCQGHSKKELKPKVNHALKRCPAKGIHGQSVIILPLV